MACEPEALCYRTQKDTKNRIDVACHHGNYASSELLQPGKFNHSANRIDLDMVIEHGNVKANLLIVMLR